LSHYFSCLKTFCNSPLEKSKGEKKFKFDFKFRDVPSSFIYNQEKLGGGAGGENNKAKQQGGESGSKYFKTMK